MLTEQLRSQISERKQELLGFLRSSNKVTPFIPPPISRRKISGPAALSFAQERLWFLEQLDPYSTGYNLCRAWRLAGGLNVAALESSLNQILRRHDVLRSAIHFADGRPLQSVQPPAKFKLEIVDLQQTPEADREAEIRRRIQETAEHPFDFAAGMFLRAEVLRVANDEHILVLATHHIVSDAWSMGILSRELWSLYKTYTAGKSSELEELPIQYADFAVWQREWLQGTMLDSQISYWKKQLADLPILNLPTDRTRALRQSFRGARMSITLPESLSAAINELSNECGVTPFMTLLAAFQVLLYRYTGEEDIVVGSPIANRSIAELEPLVGFFVNTLVLRTDLSGNPTFKELLFRVREVCLAAQEHQDLPFEKLVQELHPKRNQSRNPLFQVMFALQNATTGISLAEGMRIEPIEFETGRSLFDLSLYLRDRAGKFIGHFEYSTDLFDSSTMQRMTGHLQTLLKAIVTDRDQGISTLPLLTEPERHQLLIEWNDTSAEYPRDKCIHQLFEEQVKRTPRRIAIAFNGQSLTYRELNARANRLAYYLRGIGVGPETLVGICVERSLEMVVGLLGILKAGGAYVPLDPAYPKERLRFMLEDAQASIVVTQQKYVDGDQFSAVDHQFHRVCIDRDWSVIEHERAGNPDLKISPENLAYVIYTSGSTGRPKGVSIEQRNAVNLLSWARTVYDDEDLEGVLASTSICFDLSVFEIFVPLSWGGKVVLVENILCVLDLRGTSRVTLINTVPSALNALLAVARLPDSARTVNLAGEPLHNELVKRIYELGTVDKVYDLYGPSETTTYSTFTLRAAGGPNTIGRPIANTQIYVLDAFLQPVPVGIVGELYISGCGVGRGYWGNAELTAELFRRTPFSQHSEFRLYRTGDQARYRSDGKIEFLGRTDTQVKIRGYRVELSEIEAALRKHPRIKECTVVGTTTTSRNADDDAKSEVDNSTLVLAYYVANPGEYSEIDLRSFLREKLPQYMIPFAFIALDALPLTSNGKVNRDALVARNLSERVIQDVKEPRTQVEALILQIWRDVLKNEHIGIHDDFFQVGGHSLLAIQVVARLREAFDREIPLTALFDAPTVAGLSGSAARLLRIDGVPKLPAIVPARRDETVPLSINQEYLWSLDRMMPGTHFFNMPYLYHLKGVLDVDALRTGLREIVLRHEGLGTTFVTVGETPVQIVKTSPELQLRIDDLRRLQVGELQEAAARSILVDRIEPFNLEAGPLFRFRLVRVTSNDSLLSVVVHHIISDHSSMQVFRKELTMAYEAISQGYYLSLAPPALQFADYAIWERQSVGGEFMTAQLAYWKKQLSHLPALLDCGEGKSKSDLAFRTSREFIDLDESVSSGIKSLAKAEKCTPFMVLVAGLCVVLRESTGQTDIRIGTLVANRRRNETAMIFGHLVNTIILRFQLKRQMTFKELLAHVRSVTLQAYVYQELPFEQLACALEDERKVTRSSLCQILLNYEPYPLAAISTNGFSLTPVEVKLSGRDVRLTPSTFDWIFNMRETSTGLTGSVEYKCDRSNSAYVAGVLEDLLTVLRDCTGTRSSR